MEIKKEITARVRNTLRFLLNDTHHVNGFFYHFVDIHTGNRYGVSEISPIDMAILLCGVLTCREYFHDSQIRHDATELYRRVDWNWMLNDGDAFALEWTPEFGFSHLRWTEYSESMMLYLLALGARPGIPFRQNAGTRFNGPGWFTTHRYISSPAPLFIHQFFHDRSSFAGTRICTPTTSPTRCSPARPTATFSP